MDVFDKSFIRRHVRCSLIAEPLWQVEAQLEGLLAGRLDVVAVLFYLPVEQVQRDKLKWSGGRA